MRAANEPLSLDLIDPAGGAAIPSVRIVRGFNSRRLLATLERHRVAYVVTGGLARVIQANR